MDEMQHDEMHEDITDQKAEVSIQYAIGAVIFLIVGLAVGYYLASYNIFPKDEIKDNQQVDEVRDTLHDVKNDTDGEVVGDMNVGRLDVTWLGAKEVDPLFAYPESEYERDDSYYEVGRVTSAGEFFDYTVVLAQVWSEGLSFFPGHYRFLVKNGEKPALLTDISDFVDEWSGLPLGQYVTRSDVRLKGLVFPESINDPNTGIDLILHKEVRDMYDLDTNVEFSFTDPVLGSIYTTRDYPTGETPFASRYNQFGFYARANDGSLLVYYYQPPFIGEDHVPQFTYDKGEVNQQDYHWTNIGGCGSQNYIALADPSFVTMKDLKSVGKTANGTVIYELSDPEHAALKDVYDTDYFVWEEGAVKIPYEEFVKQHPLLYFVDPFDRLIELQSFLFIPAAECGKPVIYLYPEEDINVSVHVEPQGGFTYTEPEYNGGWNVHTTTDSLITDLATGQTYPYLFWEGRGGLYEKPDRGTVVGQSEVEAFLTESLGAMGLNDKEIADFNEFWLPRMREKPYYAISFLGTPAMNILAPLHIEPQPDTIFRVLMDFTPLDEVVEMQPQRFPSFERIGFTVVEWGGVIRSE